MDFEQWRRRPVYVVQCYTMKIARSMSVWHDNAILQFRAKREYRDERTQFIRRSVASKLREMRSSCGLNMKDIRREHEQILAQNVGYVWTGDLAAHLNLETV